MIGVTLIGSGVTLIDIQFCCLRYAMLYPDPVFLILCRRGGLGSFLTNVTPR